MNRTIKRKLRKIPSVCERERTRILWKDEKEKGNRQGTELWRIHRDNIIRGRKKGIISSFIAISPFFVNKLRDNVGRKLGPSNPSSPLRTLNLARDVQLISPRLARLIQIELTFLQCQPPIGTTIYHRREIGRRRASSTSLSGPIKIPI